MIKEFNKVVLSFHAHPDDAEAWNAGVLKLLKDRGYEINIATLTAGQLGGCNMSMEETARTREAEARKAAAVIGADYYCLGGEDGFLIDSKDLRLKAISLIRKLKTGIVFTHLPNDYHPDHRVTSNIVESAAMISSLDTVPVEEEALEITPLLYHTSPFKLTDPLGKPVAPPHFYIDVSSVVAYKKRMLEHHVSQKELIKHMFKIDDFFAHVLEGNRAYGKEVNVDYAEIYWQHLSGGFQTEPQVQRDLADYIVS